MTLDLIDQAVEQAKIASPLIRPIKYMGGEYYVAFLFPSQVRSLRTNTSAGQWLDITKAALTGGDPNGQNIFTGALGVYNGVVLHEAFRVTRGVNSSTGASVANTRRAVLAGAQAIALGFGSSYADQEFKWVESMFDYEREFGVAARAVMGMKKVVFNSADFGAIVISTYSAN